MNLGGTIDINVHQVQNNGSIKEVYKANGGDWGGTKVDASFISLLADIVGNDVIKAFSSNNKFDFLDLLGDFKAKKRTIVPEMNEKVIFRVPSSLSETFENMNLKSKIKDVLGRSNYKKN